MKRKNFMQTGRRNHWSWKMKGYNMKGRKKNNCCMFTFFFVWRNCHVIMMWFLDYIYCNYTTRIWIEFGELILSRHVGHKTTKDYVSCECNPTLPTTLWFAADTLFTHGLLTTNTVISSFAVLYMQLMCVMSYDSRITEDRKPRRSKILHLV